MCGFPIFKAGDWDEVVENRTTGEYCGGEGASESANMPEEMRNGKDGWGVKLVDVDLLS